MLASIKVGVILFLISISIAVGEVNDIATKNTNASVLNDDTQLQKQLIFCLYAFDHPNILYEKFSPLIKYIENKLRANESFIKIEFQGYSNYQKVIDKIANGECDFSRTGPASYILSKQKNTGVRLLAMETIKTKTTFKGFIVTNKKSSLKNIADLKGIRFAFGNEYSTVGRYLVQAEMVKANIYAKDLYEFEYLDRHDIVAKNIIKGKFDAGAIKESTYERYKKKLKIIHEFTNVTKPWIASASLDENIVAQLRTILLSEQDAEVLKTLAGKGFLKSDDNNYILIRQKMEMSKKF